MKKQKQRSFSQRLMDVKSKQHQVKSEKSVLVDSSRLLEIKKQIEALEQEILMLQLHKILF
jgi:hypothetical protein